MYAGYSETASADLSKVAITCLEGSKNCYTIQGNTLTFTNVVQDSVYAISGEFKGNIVIDVGDYYKFDLELQGVSLSSDTTNPIVVKSGDRVTITAKKNYKNYIYDLRTAIDEDNSSIKAGAIYSEVDLRIAGKGELTVVSENNNGIHTKKDLEVRNLTLTVYCKDNALKGNDSVTLEQANTTLIAIAGDGIKTSKSDVSGKGKQRGSISVLGGTHTVYAACDGLDAAYNVVIEEDTTVLNIYTDRYSNYSEEITAVAEEIYYIRSGNKDWKYSVKYYNSEEEFIWVQPEFHSKVSGGRSGFYYHSFPKMEQYEKARLYIYAENMEQGQESEYLAVTEYFSLNDGYDTLALENRENNVFYQWTNYTTQIFEGFGGRPGGGRGGFGGPGGWNEGNSEKGDYSTKGIKAANEFLMSAGTVTVMAYDDAVHAHTDNALENGAAPKGAIAVSGGSLSLYTNEDGLHADGAIRILGGVVAIDNSYEGIEGTTVEISGGKVSVSSKDDGINATADSGTTVVVSGGEVYIHCAGDGIDSNSRTAEEGIVFSGGKTLVISTSRGNSAIDTEKGYRYEGGQVVAMMPSGGMSQEAVNCKNFSDIGSNLDITVIINRYVTVSADGTDVITLQMPSGLSGMLVYLGSADATVTASETCEIPLDENGVCWFTK